MARSTFTPPVSAGPDAPVYFDPLTPGAFAPPDPTRPGGLPRPGLIYNRDWELLNALRNEHERAATVYVRLRTAPGGAEFRPLGNFHVLPSNFDELGLYVKTGSGYKLAYLPPPYGPDSSVDPGTTFIPEHRIPSAIRAGILPDPNPAPIPAPTIDATPTPVPDGPTVIPTDPDSAAAPFIVETDDNGEPIYYVKKGKRYDRAPDGTNAGNVYVKRIDGGRPRYPTFADYVASL